MQAKAIVILSPGRVPRIRAHIGSEYLASKHQIEVSKENFVIAVGTAAAARFASGGKTAFVVKALASL